MATRTKRLRITMDIGNVDYNSTPKTEELKPKFIALMKEILDKYEITFFSRTGKFDVDFIQERDGGRYGFAFAFSKFDDKFKTYHPDGFEYRTKEVREALTHAIKTLELNQHVKYDRGVGVFVYNVFV